MGIKLDDLKHLPVFDLMDPNAPYTVCEIAEIEYINDDKGHTSKSSDAGIIGIGIIYEKSNKLVRLVYCAEYEGRQPLNYVIIHMDDLVKYKTIRKF